MPKRKKKNNQYFTLDVDDAIEQYNNCDNIRERDRIYVKRIYPAFDKLSENLINTYKCPYIDSSFEDLKHELVSFLTEKLDKFSKESGKAYSYYTRTGINYLIARNTKNYSITKKREEVDIEYADEERNVVNELYEDSFKESLDSFITEWVSDVDEKLDILFTSQEERAIADSVLELFRLRKTMDHFSKKSLYLLIRERTQLKTQKITTVVNMLRDNFFLKFDDYQNK
jgi:hypothetical protein